MDTRAWKSMLTNSTALKSSSNTLKVNLFTALGTVISCLTNLNIIFRESENENTYCYI